MQAASGEHWKTMFKIYFGNFKGGEIDTRDPPQYTPWQFNNCQLVVFSKLVMTHTMLQTQVFFLFKFFRTRMLEEPPQVNEWFRTSAGRTEGLP